MVQWFLCNGSGIYSWLIKKPGIGLVAEGLPDTQGSRLSGWCLSPERSASPEQPKLKQGFDLQLIAPKIFYALLLF